MHSTASDGVYTPTQLVDLARRSGLAAIALTDHDTLAGVAEAQTAAQGRLEIVPGVEISTDYEGQHVHLLAYFVDVENKPLQQALAGLRQDRETRFWEMVGRLKECGVNLDEDAVRESLGSGSIGRRHLAQALVEQQHAGTIRDAFRRWLHDRGRIAVGRPAIPLHQAIALVRQAGGVAALAHPSYDWERTSLARLRGLGLGGVEVDYPGFRPSWRKQLRDWARQLGLTVTGGSDCHGPERELGAGSITRDELNELRNQGGTSARVW
jgi:predicted metal-dependent phosphoesterase TrpH